MMSAFIKLCRIEHAQTRDTFNRGSCTVNTECGIYSVISKTELNLLQFKRPDEATILKNTDTRKRTNSEIIEGIQW